MSSQQQQSKPEFKVGQKWQCRDAGKSATIEKISDELIFCQYHRKRDGHTWRGGVRADGRLFADPLGDSDLDLLILIEDAPSPEEQVSDKVSPSTRVPFHSMEEVQAHGIDQAKKDVEFIASLSPEQYYTYQWLSSVDPKFAVNTFFYALDVLPPSLRKFAGNTHPALNATMHKWAEKQYRPEEPLAAIKAIRASIDHAIAVLKKAYGEALTLEGANQVVDLCVEGMNIREEFSQSTGEMIASFKSDVLPHIFKVLQPQVGQENEAPVHGDLVKRSSCFWLFDERCNSDDKKIVVVEKRGEKLAQLKEFFPITYYYTHWRTPLVGQRVLAWWHHPLEEEARWHYIIPREVKCGEETHLVADFHSPLGNTFIEYIDKERHLDYLIVGDEDQHRFKVGDAVSSQSCGGLFSVSSVDDKKNVLHACLGDVVTIGGPFSDFHIKELSSDHAAELYELQRPCFKVKKPKEEKEPSETTDTSPKKVSLNPEKMTAPMGQEIPFEDFEAGDLVCVESSSGGWVLARVVTKTVEQKFIVRSVGHSWWKYVRSGETNIFLVRKVEDHERLKEGQVWRRFDGTDVTLLSDDHPYYGFRDKNGHLYASCYSKHSGRDLIKLIKDAPAQEAPTPLTEKEQEKSGEKELTFSHEVFSNPQREPFGKKVSINEIEAGDLVCIRYKDMWRAAWVVSACSGENFVARFYGTDALTRHVKEDAGGIYFVEKEVGPRIELGQVWKRANGSVVKLEKRSDTGALVADTGHPYHCRKARIREYNLVELVQDLSVWEKQKATSPQESKSPQVPSGKDLSQKPETPVQGCPKFQLKVGQKYKDHEGTVWTVSGVANEELKKYGFSFVAEDDRGQRSYWTEDGYFHESKKECEYDFVELVQDVPTQEEAPKESAPEEPVFKTYIKDGLREPALKEHLTRKFTKADIKPGDLVEYKAEDGTSCQSVYLGEIFGEEELFKHRIVVYTGTNRTVLKLSDILCVVPRGWDSEGKYSDMMLPLDGELSIEDGDLFALYSNASWYHIDASAISVKEGNRISARYTKGSIVQVTAHGVSPLNIFRVYPLDEVKNPARKVFTKADIKAGDLVQFKDADGASRTGMYLGSPHESEDRVFLCVAVQRYRSVPLSDIVNVTTRNWDGGEIYRSEVSGFTGDKDGDAYFVFHNGKWREAELSDGRTKWPNRTINATYKSAGGKGKHHVDDVPFFDILQAFKK